MNHDTICSCFNISMTTLKCIFNTLTSNKRLTTRYYHEVTSNLCFLTSTNLSLESFYGILCLYSICSKKGILLQTNFIFNDDTRNTQTFKCTYCKSEMFNLTSCITIKNNRLCCYFQCVVQIVKTCRQIDSFDIWLTLRS